MTCASAWRFLSKEMAFAMGRFGAWLVASGPLRPRMIGAFLAGLRRT